MSGKKKIIIPIDGVWTENGGETWHRICPHCQTKLSHKHYSTCSKSHLDGSGCKCKSAWAKGLTTKTSESLRLAGIKNSKIQKDRFANGAVQWNKGLTKETSEIIRKNAEDHTGFRHSDESKQKITEANILKWQNEEYRNRMIPIFLETTQKSWLNGNYIKKKFTKPEIAVAEMLLQLDIKFLQQFQLKSTYPKTSVTLRYYDFYLIDYNIIIEVHGDYWHGFGKSVEQMNTIQKEAYSNDIFKIKVAGDHGIKLYHIWEHDTKKMNILKSKIEKILNPVFKYPNENLSYLNLPKLEYFYMERGFQERTFQ